MENLNAEVVKKALECCIEGECDGCIYDEQTACKEYLLNDTLSLINSQEQRIKELSEKIVQLLSQVDCDKAEINLLRKHIESLGTTIEMQEQEVYSIKADTVRKMQERLKAKAKNNEWNGTICGEDIDQIAKEMLEGEK